MTEVRRQKETGEIETINFLFLQRSQKKLQEIEVKTII